MGLSLLDITLTNIQLLLEIGHMTCAERRCFHFSTLQLPVEFDAAAKNKNLRARTQMVQQSINHTWTFLFDEYV